MLAVLLMVGLIGSAGSSAEPGMSSHTPGISAPAQRAPGKKALIKLWHREGVKSARFDGLNLIVDGQVVDPRSGKPLNRPPLTYEVNVRFSTSISDNPQYVGFANGQSTYRVDLPGARKLEFQFPSFSGAYEPSSLGSVRIALVQPDGSAQSVIPHNIASQPVFMFAPFTIRGNMSDGYLRLISADSTSSPPERTVRYDTILLLQPLQMSPLNFYRSLDITDPEYAIGYTHPNIHNFFRETSVGMYSPLSNSSVVCGNIFTGHIHWQSDLLYEAYRLGRYALADSIKGWTLLDIKTGLEVPSHLASLKNKRGSQDFQVQGNYVLVTTYSRSSNTQIIICYELGEI